jgi:predicted negative regulator of RcsB-dependent stress response
MNAPRAIALCHCFNGALEFQAGHWDEAEAALRESTRLYREITAASGEALACQRLGMLLTARGQLDEAMHTMQEGVAAAEHALMRAHCLTRLYATMARNRLAAEDIATAADTLSLGLSMSERHGHCATCDALLLPAAVSVCVAQGKLDEADAFCQDLDEAADEYGSRTWMAMARQARGELAGARGDIVTALACYTAAYDEFRAANYDYEAARCQTAVAELYHRTQNEPKAQAAQLEADRTLARLGSVV